jgi:hypothetical protein
MKYYSIRVVNAVDWRMAVEAVQAQAFDEKDSLCDAVVTKAELIEKLTEKKNPFYPGDKVRYKYKDGDNIYTVYAIYSDTEVSLGLEDYPDVEQDYRTNIKYIEKI